MKKTHQFVFIAVIITLLSGAVAFSPVSAKEACPPESECPGGPGGGGWATDVAVTDIYPGNQPHGQFFFRITNHGPGTMHNVQVRVFCTAERSDINNGNLSSGGSRTITVNLNMRPGETRSFPTQISLDMNTFDYLVGCEAQPGFHDPNMGNNVHHEMFQ